MRRKLPAPRLLPATIAAMALMLGVRSVALVRAAMPAETAPAPQAAPATPAPPPASAPAPAPTSPPAAPAAMSPPAAPAAMSPPAAPAGMSPPAAPPISEGERALLLDLRRRRAELDAREAALAAREAVLSGAEKRLNARLDELLGLQTRLEALDAARRDRDEASWRGLVKLYEDMRPRDAGAIFNDLDLPVLLPILDRMKEAKAAAIMAAMQPERARLATAELAQFRAHANAVPPPPKAAGGG
jgi:flagellar motility protein MotE (MotC chaperone)